MSLIIGESQTRIVAETEHAGYGEDVLIRIQRERNEWAGLVGFAALGAAVGLIGSVVLGGVLGRFDAERMKTAVKRVRRPASGSAPEGSHALQRAVSGALGENPKTRGFDIGVRAIGGDIVELTGTVPDALARDLAGSVARGVAGADVVVNRLLVEGEDVPKQRGAPPKAG